MLHPPGASPQQTALALAVADLLTEPDHPRVPGTVTSGTPPPLNNGLTTVRHDIHLTTAGRTHDKFVWQLLATGQLPI
ncbi:hypothetical protein [Pseudofrankia sp. DC12]|uniref:hypothetical protein n=1 Tax=Pseudofrankia sp. DC12 TaxID=683315 RepID=UPI000698C788|nr:hypothetical protein [Pseudofrankia sp. DC12]